MDWRRWFAALPALALTLAGCSAQAGGATSEEQVARLRVEVIERYPHDPAAFTQGLELHDGLLYESTGQYGESDLRIVVPETGEVRESVELTPEFFAEGMTIVDDRVWQITWREQTAFGYDRDTLAPEEEVAYEGEGWGLCHDPAGGRLVMSDGSADLTFRDPVTFAPTGTVTVTRDGEPQGMLNELECVGDRVWANVWQTDEIVRIDPEQGKVDAVVDASGLLSDDERLGADVLNGIAAVPDADTFLITGKLWPSVFLVRFAPA